MSISMLTTGADSGTIGGEVSECVSEPQKAI